MVSQWRFSHIDGVVGEVNEVKETLSDYNHDPD